MKTLLALLGLGSLAMIFAGCAGGYVDEPGPTEVYGDFGYVEPWDYGAPWYDDGGVYVRPPYYRDHGGHPVDARGHPVQGHPGPRPGGAGHPSAPGGHGGFHGPSIPSAPRPSGGGGGRSGGGGGHSGGGGGGRRP